MLLITVHGSRKESLISLKKMFRLVIALALVAATLAFSPSRMVARKTELNMNLQQQISKVTFHLIFQKGWKIKFLVHFHKGLGIAAMGIALAGPVSLPAFADGAVSISTVYRARNNYGAKIFALSDAAASGNFAAFEDKKTKNAFELFMSSANALNSITDKANKKAELGNFFENIIWHLSIFILWLSYGIFLYLYYDY